MIKFLDLEKINASFQNELDDAILRVVHSGWYLLGNELRSFEKAYASFTGSSECIGVANGLDALRIIFKAYIEMGVMRRGDEIIVPANTYIASILAITDNGLTPVLVEPDIRTYNLDPLRIEERITDRTRGILLVHLYGRNAMHPEIGRLSLRYGLKLVEDNAQAIGCFHEGKRTGSLGDAAGHSFYPGKNLGALGDGGAVTTDDEELGRLVAALGNYGSSQKYVNDYQGLNSRLDDLQAAVLKIKLARLDEDNERRWTVADHYLSNIRNPKIMLPMDTAPDQRMRPSHVWHLFVVRCEQRDRLQKYLSDNGVQTLIHYPIPPHKQRAYRTFNALSLPVTEKIHREVLSLPISPVMGLDAADVVVDLINKFA